MYCKNCGNKSNDSDKFCNKCGSEILNIKQFECFKITNIFLKIITVLNIIFIIMCIKEDEYIGALILLFLFLDLIPFFISIILSVLNVVSLIKCIKKSIPVPLKDKIITILNIIIFPCIVFVLFTINSFKETKINQFVRQNLDDRYGNSYEILDTCSYSNTGGEHYEEYLIELENFKYPIISHYDFKTNTYSDNYNDLYRTHSFDYQKYINDVFNDKTIALMYLDQSFMTKYLRLNIIMTKTHLNDKSLLEYNIRQIITKYQNEFQDYEIYLNIYFTSEIDNTKTNNYYALLSWGKGGCNEEFSKNINKSELKLLSINVQKDTDMYQEIKESIETIK